MPIIVVPTPIGNLSDITERAVEALSSADLIACEDTRRTLKLLNARGIKKPLVSCHEHNERSRARELVDRAERGETIALVSDAGTPGISDPGAIVIKEAIDRSVSIDVLPGAVAFVPALLLSGLAARRFFFAGFLDEKASVREASLREIAEMKCTSIFYVSPHDVERDITDIIGAFGDRRAALSREISKVHQETLRGALSELLDISRERELRGEMVLVVDGASDRADDGSWMAEARRMRDDGAYTKEIADIISESYGVNKNTVKRFLASEGEDIDE